MKMSRSLFVASIKNVIEKNLTAVFHNINDTTTWRKIRNSTFRGLVVCGGIKRFLRMMKKTKTINWFRIYCNRSTNPSELIDKNELNGYVLFKFKLGAPAKRVSFRIYPSKVGLYIKTQEG